MNLFTPTPPGFMYANSVPPVQRETQTTDHTDAHGQKPCVLIQKVSVFPRGQWFSSNAFAARGKKDGLRPLAMTRGRPVGAQGIAAEIPQAPQGLRNCSGKPGFWRGSAKKAHIFFLTC
jgi:hypothetical protein